MRYRATALIIRDGRVLLVRDRGKHDYSMPGGKIESSESTLQAAIREVFEELKLRTVSATRLRHCDLEGRRGHHKVCQLVVEGEPHMDRKELGDYTWWDMKQAIPLQGHVRFILNRYESRNAVTPGEPESTATEE